MKSSFSRQGWLVAHFAILAGGSACGGGAATAPNRPTSEFTVEHAPFFDDGVDFVSSPESLDGRWQDDWERDLQGRVGHADLVALVTVKTLRTDTDLERKTTYRLVAHIDRLLLGRAPDEDLSLMTREGQAGFSSVRDSDHQVLNVSFIAFVKWYADEAGMVQAHWHLSPASDGVRERAEFLVDMRRQPAGSRRVIRRRG